jgi:DNA repair protein RecO (recombination protein O)
VHWSDDGIVLAARRHGESSLIVQLLTREHGRHAGLVRGGQSARSRAAFETGNRLAVTWKARLAEHLGAWSSDLGRSYAAGLMEDGVRLGCLAAAAAVAETSLPEREPHRRAYDGMLHLLDSLDRDDGWAVAFVAWELDLLAELGFGLDLTRCAATGTIDDLIYVSPKSGQAVSAAAGEAYREKLLRLPPFLRAAGQATAPRAADLLDGLALTGFFLERRVLEPQGAKIPAARSRFVDALRQLVTISGG